MVACNIHASCIKLRSLEIFAPPERYLDVAKKRYGGADAAPPPLSLSCNYGPVPRASMLSDLVKYFLGSTIILDIFEGKMQYF